MQTHGTNQAEIGWQSATSIHDRRCRVRHKVQSPAYARLTRTGNSVDLSEIVDISEDGMAIQTSWSLAVDRKESFRLDLAEIQLEAAGKVIWANSSGRVGIRFSGLPAESLHALKKWLLTNTIAAYINRAAADRAAGVLQGPPHLLHEVGPDDLSFSTLLPEEFEPPARKDYTSVLAALAAVKREVESLGTDLDAALHLTARRARAFTRATGAAIALTEGQDMTCRAIAGPDAPALGARLRINEGFSGECVRTGRLLHCEDSETDPRVDRQSCCVLGIRSIIAVPIRHQGSVIGLLEVFSPAPGAFEPDDGIVLGRLAEIVGAAVHRAASPEVEEAQIKVANVDDEFLIETPAELPLPQLPGSSRNLLLLGAGITLVLVGVWLIGPWDASKDANGTRNPAQEQSRVVSQSPSKTTPEGLQALRRLAEQGDAAAQFAFGARYATGEEVPQDYAEAVRWFTKAAEQGNVIAQATLGTYYWAGRGVPADPVKAYFWSLLAEAGGDEISKSRVTFLASHLRRRQIVATQRQANDWIKQHPLAKNSSLAPP